MKTRAPIPLLSLILIALKQQKLLFKYYLVPESKFCEQFSRSLGAGHEIQKVIVSTSTHVGGGCLWRFLRLCWGAKHGTVGQHLSTRASGGQGA
jgi:hypothetical protein